MAWCHQAARHYLNQWCWPSSLTRPQWVKKSVICSFDDFCVVSMTLLVLELEYSRRIKSLPWLLMPCLFMSPGHQQSGYWPWIYKQFFSSLRKDFNNLCLFIVEEWYKMQICISCLTIFSMERVKQTMEETGNWLMKLKVLPLICLWLNDRILLTNWGWDKMVARFHAAFFISWYSCLQIIVFWLKFRWSLFLTVYLIIGTGNGSALIIWTNDGILIYWCIYTSLGLNDWVKPLCTE